MSLVSVIIPSYKSTDTLKRAIDSCLIQTYKSIEVIVVDDNNPGSRHRLATEKIMSKYISDERVAYVRHERNMNGSAARNTGFHYSSGEFICLLDDDDYFLPNKIMKQVKLLLSNEKYNAASCYWYSKNKVNKLHRKNDFTTEILTGQKTPHTCSLMIRRHVYQQLNGFNPEYKRHQDYEFLLRFFKTSQIGMVTEPLLVLGTNGINNRLNAPDLEKLKDVFLEDFQDLYLFDTKFRKKVFASNYVEVFVEYIRIKDLYEIKRVLLLLLKNSPVYFLKYMTVTLYKYISAHFTSNDKLYVINIKSLLHKNR